MNIILRMILTLSFLGVIAGGSLALVNNWSSPIIAENQRVETEKAIFLVQPEGKTYEKVDVTGYELYKVFDEDSTITGYSLVYQGNGFQGKIRLIAGLTPDINKITAIEILDQVETPGLGTKITEDPFKDQFKGLNVLPSIKWVKSIPPSEDNEIQAITGATISSRSTVEILNAGIAQLRKLKERGEIL